MKERPSRTPKIVKTAQELILEDLGCSVRKIKTIVGLSGRTMRRIVKEDLR